MLRARPVLLTAVTLLLLAGCSVPGPTPTSTPTATPTPDAGGPVDCSTIATEAQVATALTGEDGVTPEVVPAVQPQPQLVWHLVEAAGGLRCSWRAGEGPASLDAPYGAGDWAYLTIEVLPRAADAWADWAAGGEHAPVGTYAGADAVAACGDPGCSVDLTVADAWLTVAVRADGWNTGQSRFGDADLLPAMEPVVRAAMATLDAADPAELEWPQVDAGGSRECTGALDPVGIGFALGAEGFAFEQAPWATEGDAAGRLGVYECWSTGLPVVGVTVARGAAPVLDELATTADASEVFEPVSLEGAVDGERALVSCRAADGSVCGLLFSIGTTAFEVNADDPVAVAEAMIAQAR